MILTKNQERLKMKFTNGGNLINLTHDQISIGDKFRSLNTIACVECLEPANTLFTVVGKGKDENVLEMESRNGHKAFCHISVVNTLMEKSVTDNPMLDEVLGILKERGIELGIYYRHESYYEPYVQIKVDGKLVIGTSCSVPLDGVHRIHEYKAD